MHDIFLSYSRKDNIIMQQVKQTLIDADLTVWTDEGIEAGTPSWKDAIDEAIHDCQALVCILSPDAKQSKWVKTELDRAELYEKHIFLIWAGGTRRESVPFGFESHQYTDIRDSSKFDNNIARLIGVMQRKIRKSHPKKEQPIVGTRRVVPNNVMSDNDEGVTNALAAIKALMPKPFDWCYIPAGNVTLEAGGYVSEGGKTYAVDAFHMAKYPVTNRQFAEFIGAGGYRKQSYWTDEGWELCKKNKWTQPRYFHDTKWNRPSHPVVGVSWHEAIAFCNWLNAVISDDESINLPKITLPTEQQWQGAAQGNDGWIYPWGNTWNSSLCNNNTDNKGIGKTTPVTKFPNGASPYDVMDMSGNVWEWCLGIHQHGSQETDVANMMQLRGGSWHAIKQSYFHVAYEKYGYESHVRLSSIGFRICALHNA